MISNLKETTMNLVTDDDDRINDIDAKTDQKINDLATQYADSLARSSDENEIRGEIREKIADLGISSKGFQHAVMMLKSMSAGERNDYQNGMDRVVKALADRQAELFPEEFERIKKREEAKAQTVANTLDSDTNPRSNPDAGGAKPQVPVENPPGEDAEGEAALAAMVPDTVAAKGKKAQSVIAAEKLAAAKLN